MNLSIQHLSPAKAGFGIEGDMTPGLRSLRSLTRGYYMSPLCGSVTRTNSFIHCHALSAQHNKALQLSASEPTRQRTDAVLSL
jgi:hypothetical protein